MDGLTEWWVREAKVQEVLLCVCPGGELDDVFIKGLGQLQRLNKSTEPSAALDPAISSHAAVGKMTRV